MSPEHSDRLGGLPRRFAKMTGAGNDFLVFQGRVSVGPREAETIRRLCRRGTSVGADGVLFVAPERTVGGPHRVLADYYNADGGAARFCANGTRCAARFAFLKGEAGRDMAVATGWGLIEAAIRPDGDVTLRLPEPIALGATLDAFDPEGRLLESEATSLSVGVPHLVVFTAPEVEVETLDVAALGPPLRRHPGLPDGANVTFVSVREGSRLAVRSYERGVEAETLSCGSGVVAAAVVAGARRGLQAPISVSTRSGTSLVVDFAWDGDAARDVSLTGEARLVFEATLTDESL